MYINLLCLSLPSQQSANLNKDLSLDASAKAPVLSLDGLRGKLNASQGLGGGLRGPTLNGDLPSLSQNKPSADAGTKFTMPSLGLTGPDVNGDLDGTLKAPNVRVSTPNVDVTKPEIKTGNSKYNSPKFSMPQFDLPQLSSPHANVDVPAFATPDPKLNLKSPDMDLNGPKLNLNGPDLNLGNTDIEPPSGNIKWPHQKWKGAKVKGLDGDLNADLSAPGVGLSTPKFDGDLEAPDVDINVPKAEIKAPGVGGQIPNIDIDSPSGKINWPHKKWKKANLHGSKPDLDLDANLNTPDVDLSLPKVEGGINTPDVDLNLTKADLDVPNLDADASTGKINWPHLKWKKPKVQGPKADLDIDADLNTPDGQLSSPNITLPNAELNGPDVDFDAPSGKINWPHKKWKKPKLKADMDLNADLNTPDVGLSVPNLESDISTPGIDLNSPKADANFDPPSGKVKFPTLKKPKFMLSGPKVKTPDVDIHADTPGLNLNPDIDLNSPNVKAPDTNIDLPSGKINWPTLKKPKFGTLKGPKADLDADLSAPDVHLSAPNIEGGLDTPDLDCGLPNADVKGLDVDLNGPDLDTPDGKLKFPSFKLPTFKGLHAKGPELDTDLKPPVIEAQDLSLSAPKIEGGIDALDSNISLPRADLKGPDVDLQAPEFGASTGKVKMPKLKFPTFGLSGPRVKGPNVDADLRSPELDLSLPGVDAEPPKANLTAPDFNLEAPKIKGGIAAPDWNLKTPDVDVKTPDVDVKTPDVDIDAPGKFKMPSFKLPKWSIGGPKAQLPDAELTTPGVSVPDVDVNLPAADVKAPKWKLSAPTFKGDLDAPDINAKGDLGLPKAGPSLQAPDLNLKAPDLSLSSPNIDGNFSVPNIDTKVPKAQLEAPGVDINLPKANLNGPDAQLNKPAFNSSLGDFKFPFKLPKFGHSQSEVEVPSLHPSAEAGINAPKVNIGNITADANMSAPKLDTSLDTESDGSGDEMEIPAFRSHRLPRHGIDGSESIDILELSKPVTEDKEYVVSKGIRLPILNAKSAGGEKIDIMERLKMAMQKPPSTNVTPTEVKTDIDLKLAAPSLNASASAEAGDSSLVRGGTYKVEKLDENDKMSLGLSNMLGLNVKD